MVLRCYQCGGKFTLSRMAGERVTALPLIAACPHCGTEPELRTKENRTTHRIFDLRSEHRGVKLRIQALRAAR